MEIDVSCSRCFHIGRTGDIGGDIGINRVVDGSGKAHIVGDVAFDEVREVAGAITPVPGGVGPMTIACLLANTVRAACALTGVPMPSFSLPLTLSVVAPMTILLFEFELPKGKP